MNRGITIIYIVSDLNHSEAIRWVAEALALRHDFVIVVLNPVPGPLEKKLESRGIRVVSFGFRRKADLPAITWRLYRLFRRLKPAVVHAHLLAASLSGLTAAWLARVPKRIYTRHTSTFHHVYEPAGIKLDLICNALATRVISISQATDYALHDLERIPSEKVVRIPHGFQFNHFDPPGLSRVEDVRRKWNLNSTSPRVGVVARHIEWKGIQFAIAAFRKFQQRHQGAQLVLANATGPYHAKIRELLAGLPSENVVLIPFEEDMAALYRLFDVYVHTPVDKHCEAFGQTYVEALACGIPSVFTSSGIAAEVVQHEVHALIVPYRDEEATFKAMVRVWESADLKDQFRKEGPVLVRKHFELSTMMDKLEELYHE